MQPKTSETFPWSDGGQERRSVSHSEGRHLIKCSQILSGVSATWLNEWQTGFRLASQAIIYNIYPITSWVYRYSLQRIAIRRININVVRCYNVTNDCDQRLHTVRYLINWVCTPTKIQFRPKTEFPAFGVRRELSFHQEKRTVRPLQDCLIFANFAWHCLIIKNPTPSLRKSNSPKYLQPICNHL